MFNKLSKLMGGVYLCFAFLSGSVSSQEGNEQRYGQCMDLAAANPDKAIDHALGWRADGGGVPARHCEAVALYHSGEYGESALRLEQMIEDMRVGRDMPIKAGQRMVASPELLSEIYKQISDSWLLAGEISRASGAIDAAISLMPVQTPQSQALLIDRAQIAAADDDFELALHDLQAVSIQDPGRQDIYVFIASAHRAMGDFDKALGAIERFKTAYPDDLSGHLEHAHILDALGHTEKAQAAYLKLVEFGEGTDFARIGRANLERLALGKKAEE